MKVQVTHTKLEAAHPKPGRQSSELVSREVRLPNASLNRFFYFGVGSDWLWYARRPWSYDQWDTLVRSEGYRTWVAYHDDTPVGYFELDARQKTEVEVAYFGLLPEYIGLGLGRELIQACLAEAWAISGTKVVWLSTCTLDHPGAMKNYLKAGFVETNNETVWEEIPDEPLEPWPSSGRAPATSVSDHV